MNKKEFSKFFVASLKRTAQNVSPLVRRKQKLQAEMAEKQAELESIQIQLDAYEAPIKEATGGYTTEDLVERVVEVTDKVDKDGKPVKLTKWNLKYPETIVPETPVPGCGSDSDIDLNEQGSEALTQPEVPSEVESETTQIAD